MKYTFVIVDDHPLFRGALKLALSSKTNDVDIVEIGDLESAKVHPSKDLQRYRSGASRSSLNGIGGLTGLISLRVLQPMVPMAIVSATDDRSLFALLWRSAHAGFISKSSSPEIINEAVKTILDGQIWSPLVGDEVGELDPEIVELIRACES